MESFSECPGAPGQGEGNRGKQAAASSTDRGGLLTWGRGALFDSGRTELKGSFLSSG